VADAVANGKTRFAGALVVDDEGGLQMLVKAILEHGAYLVDVAKDGLEACQRVRATRYDAIICDIFMPNMDGLTFYQKLRDIDRNQADRVIFVTGADLEDDIVRAVRECGRPVLRKPFEIDEFSRTVDSVAGGEL